MGNLGPWEILIIAGVIILLFGARKMPEMARSLGKSARILKAETKGMRSDETADTPAIEPPAQAQSNDEVEKLRQQLAEAENRAKAAEQQLQVPQVAPSIEQTQAKKNAG